MTELKRIGVMSLANLWGSINFVIGIIAGIGALIAGRGFLTFLGTAIIAGIGGFIWGAVIAILYNIFASQVGGVELKLTKR